MSKSVDEDEELHILAPANSEADQEPVGTTCYKRPKLVEPVIFLYHLASFGFAALTTEYIFNKIKMKWIAKIVMTENSTWVMTSELDAEISTVTSDWTLFINLAKGVPSVFSSLAVVAITERYGRKLGLLLPVLGGLIEVIGYSLIETYNLDIAYLMIPSVINGLSGYQQCLLGAGFLYVEDVASLRSRSNRFIFIQVCVTLGVTVANLVMGELIDLLSWFNCFLIVGGVYLVTVLWIITLLPESKNFSSKPRFPRAKCFWLIDTAIAFKVYSKPRINPNTRPLLIAMGCLVAINGLLSYGIVNLGTLYLLGQPFHYDSVTIGNFLAEQGLIFSIGPLLIVPAVVWCSFTDLGIILYGLISGGLTFTVMGLAKSKTTLFVSPLLGALSGVISAVPRSLMSKIIANDEQCSLQASVSCLNSVGGVASVTVLVAIYGATVSFYPGFTFVMIGVMYLLLIPMVSKFWCISKKERSNTVL